VLTVADAQTSTEVLSPDVNNGAARSTVTATASGIHVLLPSGAALDIGQIEQQATAEAAGRGGTAWTKRSVSLHDIRVTLPSGAEEKICVGSCINLDPAVVLDALNSIDPSHAYVTLPTPDEPFGSEVDGVSPKGSPGGYQAIVQASQAQQQGDALFNQMTGLGGTEQTLLPALRIVLFNPGSAQINRLVLDFAGVEAEAKLGKDVNLSDAGVIEPPPTTVELTQSLVESGAVGNVSVASSGGQGTTGASQQRVAYQGGLLGVLERTLDGLRALIRSPFAGVQMAAFLVLLGLPLMLVRRRWTWRRLSSTRG
jgi:hypothetical protein